MRVKSLFWRLYVDWLRPVGAALARSGSGTVTGNTSNGAHDTCRREGMPRCLVSTACARGRLTLSLDWSVLDNWRVADSVGWTVWRVAWRARRIL